MHFFAHLLHHWTKGATRRKEGGHDGGGKQCGFGGLPHPATSTSCFATSSCNGRGETREGGGERS